MAGDAQAGDGEGVRSETAPRQESASEELLSGVRVVEFATEIAGPYCSKLLLDAGAEVVKVEPSTGDPLRTWSASGSDTGQRDGALFRYLNASKRSVVSDDGPSGVRDLLGGANIVVESGQLDQAEIDAIRAEHPHLSVVSVTAFGRQGPWSGLPATEFTLQALCGSTASRGTKDREPLHAGGRLGEWIAGTYAAVAAVALMFGWRSSGQTDHADVSMLECMSVTMGGYSSLQRSFGGARPPGPPRTVEIPSIERTRDGEVGFCTITHQQFADFLVMIGHAELTDDADLASFVGRQKRRDEFLGLVHAWTREQATDDIIELATAFRIPVAPIGRPETIMRVDQFEERGVFVRHGDGDFRQPRRPYIVDDEPLPEPGAAPALGEGNGQIAWEPAVGGDGSAEPQLPLAGVRIVDLTAFWAGPSATQMLAALGADVIKVESIQRPDGMRFSGGRPPTEPNWWEWGSIFQAVNTNKRGVTLDLTSDRGRALLLDLVRESDVLIENFSPRVLDSFGITRDVLLDANPRVVIARMPAFGLTGPWRDRTGFAQTMEQASGMAWLTGFDDGPPIIPRGPCDPIAGMHAAFAVIAALDHRARSGSGHFLECTMVEAALNVAAELAIEYDAYGATLQRAGNRGPVAAPQGLYRCRGEESWLALAITDDHHWQHLGPILGDSEWTSQSRFATAAGRNEHADEIDEYLRTWTSSRDRDWILGWFWAAGIAAAPVVDPADVVDLPHLRATGFVESFEHPIIGRHDVIGVPFRLAARDLPWIQRASPTLGEHNEEVLGKLLGLSAAEIEQLRDAGVIGDRPVGV